MRALLQTIHILNRLEPFVCGGINIIGLSEQLRVMSIRVVVPHKTYTTTLGTKHCGSKKTAKSDKNWLGKSGMTQTLTKQKNSENAQILNLLYIILFYPSLVNKKPYF
jgi:hypothetical protein